MGRLPENEDLKTARGTLRADRQQKEVSFTPLEDMVNTPKGLLSRRAKFEYRRVVKALSADGLAAEADRSLLIAYCNEMASYSNLAKEVAEAEEILAGMQVTADTMAKYKALLLQIDYSGRKRDGALKNAMKLGEMFGLTPSGRGKIKPTKKKDAVDPTAAEFDKLMKSA